MIKKRERVLSLEGGIAYEFIFLTFSFVVVVVVVEASSRNKTKRKTKTHGTTQTFTHAALFSIIKYLRK